MDKKLLGLTGGTHYAGEGTDGHRIGNDSDDHEHYAEDLLSWILTGDIAISDCSDCGDDEI